ncbi:hypothetical protein JCM8097_008207 [Rhodosporidiobolus ruineniae]
MPHYDSASSASSSDRSHRRRPPSSTACHLRGASASAPYDPPYAHDGSSSSGDSSSVSEDEAVEAGRGRRADERSAGGGRGGQRVYEMRSLASGGEKKPKRRFDGLNTATLVHNILPGNKSRDAEKVPLASSTAQTDLEHQASQNRHRRRVCTSLSPVRIFYLGGVLALCVFLVVVSIVVGVKGTKEKEKREEALVEANPDYEAAQEYLAQQGEHAQKALAAYVTDTAVDAHATSPGATAAEDHSTASSASFAPSATLDGPSTTSSAVVVSLPSPTGLFAEFPELQELFVGNREFRNETVTDDPDLLPELAEAQHPKFAYIGCADSRVPETTVLGTKPGELFVTRNVGNQYLIDDLSSETVMSYAIQHLGVAHIVVMGHTECGAVQAAITTASDEVNLDIGETRIDTWISPIRSLYSTSNRTEIVDFRTSTQAKESIAAADVTDEVWRALVEENVKLNVERVASDSSVKKAWSAYYAQESNSTTSATVGHERRSPTADEAVELWVHGWVYDVSTGLVSDLGVSVGPHGAYQAE